MQAAVFLGAGAITAAAAHFKTITFQKRSPFIKLHLRRFSRPVWPAARAAPQGAVAGNLSVPENQYPEVARSDFTEEKHGVSIADPYRWLEEPDSVETKSFIDDQNKVTDAVMAKCTGRTELKDMITKLMDYPRHGIPFKRGDRWYYYSNTGLQNQNVLYTCAGPGAVSKVFFDPNTLSEDGTTALSSIAFSHDGAHAAIMISEKGSDWHTVKVLQVSEDGSTTEAADVLEYIKFSGVSWSADNLGFFYSRYKAIEHSDLGTETTTAENQLLYYHRLGTSQKDDVFLFANPAHPTWMTGASATFQGRWVWITVSDGCVPANMVYVVDLNEVPRAPDGALDFAALKSTDESRGALWGSMKCLASDFKAQWSLVAADGASLTIETNASAPRNRLISIDTDAAAEGALSSGKFQEVLAQHPKDLLEGATPLKGDLMVVQWMRDVQDVTEIRKLSDGTLLATVEPPEIGTMSGIHTEPQRATSEFWFSLETFLEPTAIFRMDAEKVVAQPTGDSPVPAGQPTLFQRTPLRVPHNPGDYVTKQVFVKSKDGTKVPMFVTHRKGASLGPSTPALLYGYGGFNIPLQPMFSASWLAWIKAYDGVFAMANLRGGGEYGREWRDDGSLTRKQNVFDDFQACAAFLSEEGYTSPRCLSINGGSNGGLLVAACANQRPDLYGCVLAQVGVMDMLRFHLFTIGHAWRTDFGDPENPDHFDYLHAYSPYHNVRSPEAGQYPAMMLLTASHDDRVVPLHSFKLLAELQHQLVKEGTGTQSNPLIGRFETKAGHGAGKPTSKIIEEKADMLAFAAAACGAKMVPAQ